MDEVDSIGSARSDSGGGGGGDSEVQRTMLELLNQLDGFEATNKIKVGLASRKDVIHTISVVLRLTDTHIVPPCWKCSGPNRYRRHRRPDMHVLGLPLQPDKLLSCPASQQCSQGTWCI